MVTLAVIAAALLALSTTLAVWRPGAPDELATMELGDPRFAGDVIVALAGNRVIAFDAVTTDTRWAYDSCPAASWPGPYPTPVGAVVAVSCGASIVGLDVATGTQRWRRSRDFAADRTRYMSDTLLFNGDDGRFHAVDVLSGELLMAQRGFGGSNGAATSRLLVVSNNFGVTAFDRATGQERWVNPSPASGLFATDGAVFARTNYHTVVRIDDVTGLIAWTSERESTRLDYSDLPGVTDHTVVAHTAHRDRHRVTVYDRTNGGKLWEYDARAGSTAFPELGSTIIVLTDTFTGTVTVHDDRTGAELRRFNAVPGSRAAALGTRVAYVEQAGGRRVVRSVDVSN